MNESYVVLEFYPEQKKSLCKLMSKAVNSGIFSDKKYNYTCEQVAQLKSIIEENMEFFIHSLVKRDGCDNLSVISEVNMFCSVLQDDNFLWLLVKNSLTNRIVDGCEKQQLSEGVIYRIRECATAYMLLIDLF